MIRFNSRGHEIVDSTPFEPSVYLNRPPRETLADQIRRMVMLERMDANDQIVDEADMMEDLNDFSDDTSDENLFESSYEVADDVADGFSAEAFRQEQANKNSVSNADSGTESAGGTE